MLNPVSRAQRQRLKTENKKQSRLLREVPDYDWPQDKYKNRIRVWRSRDFLVQEFKEDNDVRRLSINRTIMLPDGDWDDNITWDELQRIKSEVGYGDWEAVEVFPKDCNVVNVASMRHLWILPDPLNFGWKGDI